MSYTSKTKISIWDKEDAPPPSNRLTVLWRQYVDNDKPNFISMPQQVDLRAEGLRSKYLSWIYDLGVTEIDGKKITNHMYIRENLSYWWMASIAQKYNIYGASPINDAIKVIALERILIEKEVTDVLFSSSNHNLSVCLSHLCKDLGILFIWNRETKNRAGKSLLLNINAQFPRGFRAFLSLSKYLLKQLTSNKGCKSIVPANEGEVTLIDVLVHLGMDTSRSGCFKSNYWTVLVDKLTEWKIKTNWIHLFFPHPEVASIGIAQDYIKQFNRAERNQQHHVLLDSKFSFTVLKKGVRDYLKLSKIRFSRQELDKVRPAGSVVKLWSLFDEEWRDSIYGPKAIHNCLVLALFEELFTEWPIQKLGIYLLENQPWEIALAYAWRMAGHGRLIGSAHSTVRIWDLRYQYDHRTYENSIGSGFAQPDYLAVNGPVASKNILSSGYPMNRVIEVEALRYLHLLNTKKKQLVANTFARPLRVLICGDFTVHTNRRLIGWLELAAPTLPQDTTYTFKPHPAYPFDLSNFAYLRNVTTTCESPLSELLNSCDVLYTSNITSASVDSYCAGIPVIQMLDGNSYNMSPLQGLDNIAFASSPSELTRHLTSIPKRSCTNPIDFFYLDNALPRWLGIINKMD